MTNHPRYSSPPPPPGRRPGGQQNAGPGYPGAQRPAPYHQPYDWRYATQQQQQQQQSAAFRAPYDPYRPMAGGPAGPPPEKRSRAGALTLGALAVAMVSAGIGGGVALLAQPDPPAA